jgi:squalene monooxygenase
MHINMDEKNEQRRKLHHEADVVVVGAGILGCAVAVALGNQGRSVIVLERSLREPDRIVGELLQPGGVQALEKLGLRDCLEEIDAVKVFGYDVIYYGNEVQIAYPAEALAAEDGEINEKQDVERGTKRKRPEGRSFHHGRFVQRLREKVLAHPNVTVVEATATGLAVTPIKSWASKQLCKANQTPSLDPSQSSPTDMQASSGKSSGRTRQWHDRSSGV